MQGPCPCPLSLGERHGAAPMAWHDPAAALTQTREPRPLPSEETQGSSETFWGCTPCVAQPCGFASLGLMRGGRLVSSSRVSGKRKNIKNYVPKPSCYSATAETRAWAPLIPQPRHRAAWVFQCHWDKGMVMSCAWHGTARSWGTAGTACR